MIILTGSTGYIGSAFIKFFKSNGIDYTTYKARYPLDKEEFETLLRDTQAHAVINCAGYTGKPNVDACESPDQQEECLMANAFLPAQLADACFWKHVKLAHVSSGCIYFDKSCEKGDYPSSEIDHLSPSNFNFETGYRSYYSGSKALGEKLLKECREFARGNIKICRLRVPFNGEYSDRNYLVKLLKYKTLLNCTNSLSNIEEFVRETFNTIRPIHYLEESEIVKDNIFNLTQPGFVNTKQVIELLGRYDLVDPSTITYFDTYDHFLENVKAPRSNCVLKSNSVTEMTPVLESIENSIKDLKFNIDNEEASP